MYNVIEDGTGDGYKAGVTDENRLRTESKSDSIQHAISNEDEQAYQCIGTATLSSGTVTALHIKNTSAKLKMIITYIRHQVVDGSGGTVFPNASNYFKVSLGRKYGSVGSVSTPINVYAGSGNLAETTAYQDNPTLTGTANEIDRWYTKANGDMNSFNKEGALIISPNETLELSYVGDQTSGTLYTRISFLMD